MRHIHLSLRKLCFFIIVGHVDNEVTLAENLDNLGRGHVDQEVEISKYSQWSLYVIAGK